MNRQFSRRLRQHASAVAALASVTGLAVSPAHAQFGGPPMAYPAPPQAGYNPQYGGASPGNFAPGGYPGNNGPGGYPAQPGYSQQAGNGQGGYRGRGGQGPGNNGRVLPDGIDQLYALQGANALVLFGTKEGYETALEVVRNIDGDLDIIRTQVTLVKTTRADLAALGVTLTDNPPTAGDVVKLVAARQQGTLRATDAIRLTTRENIVMDALLGNHASELPISIVPRVTKAGDVAVEFTQPAGITVVAHSRETGVIVLPGAGMGDSASVSLLFVTPTILPSDYRPAK